MTSTIPSDPICDSQLARKHLLIIALTATAARLAVFALIYLIQNQTPALVGGGDASAYMGMAHYVYHTGEISNSLFLARPLLFPALAGISYHLIGENVFAIIFANLAMNVVTCLLVYRLARTIGQPPGMALAAGLIAAVYPAMLLSSVSFMTEALSLLLVALALLLFARFMLAPNWRDLLCSGAVLAAASLTRLVTLLLPVLLVGLIVRRGKAWRRYVAVFLIIAILPGVILVYRNWYYGGIPTVSTEGQWILLFMRAASSERRATGDTPQAIYARYVQEIERRLGNPVPQLDSIQPEAIWGYFQPTPAAYAVMSQMAIEKNLAYPQWYILNSLYGLHRILSLTSLLPVAVSIPVHYGFVLLAGIGLWVYWRSDRRWAWLLGLPMLLAIGLTVALETAVLDTRHGLVAALPMFVLAGQGLEAVRRRLKADRHEPPAAR